MTPSLFQQAALFPGVLDGWNPMMHVAESTGTRIVVYMRICIYISQYIVACVLAWGFGQGMAMDGLMLGAAPLFRTAYAWYMGAVHGSHQYLGWSRG